LSTYKEIQVRRNKIYDIILSHDSISVEKLSSLLNISKMAVRRDLNVLEKKGGIQRLHGGVSIRRNEEIEPPYIIRSFEMKKEKRAIGRAAASILREKEVILIDVGSTHLELLKNIPSDMELTIITHWIPAVLECKSFDHLNVTLLGGKVDLKELSLSGGYPEEMLENYIADKLFLGVAGISTKYGLTDFKMEEIRVKRQMIKCAKKVIVLADNSKFDRVSPIKICDLDKIDQVISDEGIDKTQRVNLENLGIDVLVATNTF